MVLVKTDTIFYCRILTTDRWTVFKGLHVPRIRSKSKLRICLNV